MSFVFIWILFQVTIYRRLLIGRDGHLDQSEAYDISRDASGSWGKNPDLLSFKSKKAILGRKKFFFRSYSIIIYCITGTVI